MTVHFFGPRWDSPRLDDATQVPTPDGECLTCTEPIADGDRGLIVAYIDADMRVTARPVHAECELLGILGHMYGVCSCSEQGYDSSRAAARELWRRIEAARGVPW